MSTPQEQDAMEAPMSSSLGAMGPLLRKLDLLLAPEYPLRKSLKQAIELLKEDLEEVGTALVEQSMLESPSNKAKYWMDEVREFSYDIEDCIDDMMRPHTGAARSVHFHRVARLKINRLSKLLKPSTRIARVTEIRALVWQASERYERYQLDACSSNSNPLFAFTGTHSRFSAPGKTSANLVGVDNSRKELTEWIINTEEKQLKVLSIVGSAGIGKTTLIKALYRELKSQFECGAIIRVSRKPDMSKLLGEIIYQIQGPKQTSDTSGLQNSIDSIREHLQDKRYFIVIDDLWDATAWDILNNAFPKGNNCSRIIITAEVQDIFTECGGCHSVNCFEMKPLGSHDSEKLFLHRAFGSENHCPDHLKDVSCRIVKECGGLPLAIITMAGLLASKLDNRDLWNQLLQCFFPGLAILTLEERLEKIVNLCYNSLPQYLKTCLLYLNIYPEWSTIWKVDLLKQWIAEGFVSPTEGKVVVAESYFDELVNRGMIQPEKINHNDEVLSCTVHHSIRDLITHKSSEKKFITAIDYSQTITGVLIKAHRLSLHFSCAMYASKPQDIRLSKVRSFAFFGLLRCMPSIVEFIHLRVLNLELWGDYDDCTTLNLSGISKLFQLRYLKVSSRIFVELPSRIQGLQFLETLEIDAKLSGVPNDIAYLPSLLHLSLRKGTKLPDGIGGITSLQTLQYFDLGNNSEDNVRSLGELINLHDLHLTCTEARSDEHLKRNLAALSSSLERLASLRSLTLAPSSGGMTLFVNHHYVMVSVPIFLQRIELSSPICTFSKFPEWIAKLQKLRTLKIIVRVLVQNDIDILAGLPVLTSLSLFVRRPTLESVAFHSGAFPVLKYFKYRCGAICLVIEDKALPNLGRLKIGFNVHRGGQYANMISGVEYLFNLKEIAVEIGTVAGAESDRRAAEFALKNAIHRHPRFHYFLNIKRVDWIEEEQMLPLPIPVAGVRCNMAAPPQDGQEMMIAAGQHIVKSHATSKNDDDNCRSLVSDLIPPLPSAAAAVDSIMESQKSLSLDYLNLLINGQAFSDVAFSVEGRLVHAHRCVLAARSPFFRKLFCSLDPNQQPPLPSPASRGTGGGAPATPELVIPVSSIRYEVLVLVLQFLYSGQASVAAPKSGPLPGCGTRGCWHTRCGAAVDLALETLAAARSFGVEQLALLVQKQLESMVKEASIDDVMKVLMASRKFEMQQLWTVCSHLVARSCLSADLLSKHLPIDVVAKIEEVRATSRYSLVATASTPRSPFMTHHYLPINAPASGADSDHKIRRMRRALDAADIQLVKLMVMGEGLDLDDALAVHYAVQHCNRDVVKALLELGAADVNSRAGPTGKTSLHLAAEMVSPDMVSVLLDHHADPNARTFDGVTPLDVLRSLTSEFLFKGAVPGLTHIDPSMLRLCLELVQSAVMVTTRHEGAAAGGGSDGGNFPRGDADDSSVSLTLTK